MTTRVDHPVPEGAGEQEVIFVSLPATRVTRISVQAMMVASPGSNRRASVAWIVNGSIGVPVDDPSSPPRRQR